MYDLELMKGAVYILYEFIRHKRFFSSPFVKYQAKHVLETIKQSNLIKTTKTNGWQVITSYS